MGKRTRLSVFLFPELNLKFFIRASIVGCIAFVLFGYICIPLKIKGRSMEPVYLDGDLNFCFTLPYRFRKPQRFDAVFIRFAGTKVMLLKRVIALEGEVIEFRNGTLYINHQLMEEPHVVYKGNWNLSERRVEPNHVYVVGDNRGVPMELHDFGQVSVLRIIGVPLW